MISMTTCYRFLPLSNSHVERIHNSLNAFAARTGLRGLCLLGTEGINLTVSADNAETLAEFKGELSRLLDVSSLTFKDSTTARHPFHVFKVKVKSEIVTLGRPGMAPQSELNAHLSPLEWNRAMQMPGTVVLDTRNDYEVDIGKFKGALDFRLQEFRDFPEAVRQSGIAKDQQVLMYCTGGIRCEKAILEMRNQGYTNVHQLQGGILNYLKECPDDQFEGECFVFDYRVAVDQHLNPSAKYRLCPHCGDPSEQEISCVQCHTKAYVCAGCLAKGIQACSKNCAHHHAIGSRSRKPHLPERAKRLPT